MLLDLLVFVTGEMCLINQKARWAKLLNFLEYKCGRVHIQMIISVLTTMLAIVDLTQRRIS
jgi:hypothetical protein